MLLEEKTNQNLRPFLKWAGGKRWLAQLVRDEFVKHCSGTYIEPFLGGGSVFFCIQPEKAILGDLNVDLLNAYEAIRSHPAEVLNELARLDRVHSASLYYEMRAKRPRSIIKKAVRFIYLNRTCWNGLYRVNRRGEFNVPIGSKTWVIEDGESFDGVSVALSKADLRSSDFEELISESSGGDFIYIDPPYTVRHNLNGFVKYNDRIFSWQDQVRLRDSVLEASRRGVNVLISNADHASIRELYQSCFFIRSVGRSSKLAANPSKRGPTTELLVSSYDPR